MIWGILAIVALGSGAIVAAIVAVAKYMDGQYRKGVTADFRAEMAQKTLEVEKRREKEYASPSSVDSSIKDMRNGDF